MAYWAGNAFHIQMKTYLVLTFPSASSARDSASITRCSNSDNCKEREDCEKQAQGKSRDKTNDPSV